MLQISRFCWSVKKINTVYFFSTKLFTNSYIIFYTQDIIKLNVLFFLPLCCFFFLHKIAFGRWIVSEGFWRPKLGGPNISIAFKATIASIQKLSHFFAKCFAVFHLSFGIKSRQNFSSILISWIFNLFFAFFILIFSASFETYFESLIVLSLNKKNVK